MRIYALAGICLTFYVTLNAAGGQDSVVVASTTSLDNSGFYDYILPQFFKETGIRMRVIAVGTGRALNIARKGDADLLIVHDEEAEIEFVKAGYGTARRTFMYNHYVLVGPKNDPAGILRYRDVEAALHRIVEKGALFVSRGDNSGTHKRELSLWRQAGITPEAGRGWYRELGSSMGAALNVANQLGAYTLSDYATWLTFNNRADLQVVVRNDNAQSLLNPYSLVLLNPSKYPAVRYKEAETFSNWLISGRGADLIKKFEFNGTPLFFPGRGR